MPFTGNAVRRKLTSDGTRGGKYHAQFTRTHHVSARDAIVSNNTVRLVRNPLCAGAVARAPTVRSVVLTSSVAAVYGNPHERGASHVFTEEDWNCTASETVLPYFYR